jgi:hypothetical protein
MRIVGEGRLLRGRYKLILQSVNKSRYSNKIGEGMYGVPG